MSRLAFRVALLSLSCVALIYVLQEQSRMWWWYDGPPMLIVSLLDASDTENMRHLAQAHRLWLQKRAVFAGGLCVPNWRELQSKSELWQHVLPLFPVKTCPSAFSGLYFFAVGARLTCSDAYRMRTASSSAFLLPDSCAFSDDNDTRKYFRTLRAML